VFDLIVVGGGPAGLAAAVYAVRQRLDVLLVAEKLGGKTEMRCEFQGISDTSVIRAKELVERFKNELSYLDIACRIDRVSRILGLEAGSQPVLEVQTLGEGSLEARSVVVASGCSFKPPRLPGAAKYLLKGIGYSAISYAHLFLDRTVVVIGGGPRAAVSAERLAHSARQVYLLPDNGSFSETGGARAMLGRGGRENITLLEGHRVAGFNGELFAREILLIGPDGREKAIEADGFFIESEAVPNSGMVAGLVELDDRGYISIDSRNHTSHQAIAAAGDVTDVHREQVLVALGEGAKAALSVQQYLFGSSRRQPRD
jgi:thioredoxin reductase